MMDDSGTMAIVGRVFNVVALAGSLRGQAHEKFGADGRLTHQPTRDVLATFLQRFTDLIALHVLADLAGRSARQASANAH